jgi:hypothetical protein
MRKTPFFVIFFAFLDAVWAVQTLSPNTCQGLLTESQVEAALNQAIAVQISRGESVRSALGDLAQLGFRLETRYGKVLTVAQHRNQRQGPVLLRKFDSKGYLRLEEVRLNEFFMKAEYWKGREVYSLFAQDGAVSLEIDQKGGRLRAWRVDRLTLFVQPEVEEGSPHIEHYDLNAELQITSKGQEARLITSSGQVLAKVGLRHGKMHGAYSMYDPAHWDRVLISGEYRGGVRVGVWRYGLSRQSLEKVRVTYDDHGRELHYLNPGVLEKNNWYDDKGLRIRSLETHFERRRVVDRVFDPHTEHSLLEKSLRKGPYPIKKRARPLSQSKQ